MNLEMLKTPVVISWEKGFDASNSSLDAEPVSAREEVEKEVGKIRRDGGSSDTAPPQTPAEETHRLRRVFDKPVKKFIDVDPSRLCRFAVADNSGGLACLRNYDFPGTCSGVERCPYRRVVG